MLPEGIDTAYGPLIGTTARVLSWNLWWRFGPWEARLPAIVETAAALDPDIICLQEVWFDAEGRSSAHAVAERLGHHVAVAHELVLDGIGFGNAVVSRWPITGQEHIRLPAGDAFDEERTCLRADIDGPRGPLQIFCTHLNWRFDQSHIRQQQVRDICTFVADSPAREFPPLLCGDFNAVPTSDEMRMLTGQAAVPRPPLVFHDAWDVAGDGGPGLTWSNDNPHAQRDLEPDRRLDYVLAGWAKTGGRGHVVACEVVGTEPIDGMVPSDHYGVLATVRY